MALLPNSFIFFLVLWFILAVAKGYQSKKLLKHLVAACNVSAITILLYYILQVVIGQINSENTDQVRSQVQDRHANAMIPSLLQNYRVPDNPNAKLNRVCVFIDISGSISDDDISNRLQLLNEVLNQTPQKEFHYFGSCFGRIESDNPTTDYISKLRSNLCPDGIKVKSSTDVLGAIRYAVEILNTKADDRTLCLFITDDIQSTHIPEVGKSISELLRGLTVLKSSNVIFELVRVPGTGPKLISSHFSSIFSIDEVQKNTDLRSRIQQILRHRVLSNDVRPGLTEGEDVGYNNKIRFANFHGPKGKSTNLPLLLEVTSEYEAFPVVLHLDSIVSEDWKATPIAADYTFFNGGQTMSFFVPVKVTSAKRFPDYLIYTQGQFSAKAYYQILFPGSNQINVRQYFDTTFYRPYAMNRFTGQLAGFHHVNLSFDYYQQIPWQVFVIYISIFLAIGYFLRTRIKPTLNGRKLYVIDKLSRQKYMKDIRDSDTCKFDDEYQREVFRFKAKTIRVNPINFLSQPDDSVVMASKVAFRLSSTEQLSKDYPPDKRAALFHGQTIVTSQYEAKLI